MATMLTRDWLLPYPEELRLVLGQVARRHGQTLYVAGGPVRDWLLGVAAKDLDLTLPSGAVAFAREVSVLLGGAFVLLDEGEDVARVVWQGLTLDFSAFRNRTVTIEDDLRQRDFTINALAIPFDPESGGLADLAVIDPLGGAADLARKIMRATSVDNLLADPLRLLRAYRFMATLDFTIEAQTAAVIAAHGRALCKPARERVRHELDLLLAAPGAYAALNLMAQGGILEVLFPELTAGRGLEQPASHHLDVFGHSLEALSCMEKILAGPARYFPGQEEAFVEAALGKNARLLKWAALFHDLGKPQSYRLLNGKITFHQHDRQGAALFSTLAERLRWAREDRERVARLIALHMWPFHLSNAHRRSGAITRKACLRLVKAAGDDLASLFLLAMADSLAGQGREKPPGMEDSLAALFAEVRSVYEDYIRPVLAAPPLLNGHDLIKELALTPGPIFKEILEGLLAAQVDGLVADRTQALSWAVRFLEAGEKGKE